MTVPRVGQPEEIQTWHGTSKVYVPDARAHWQLFHDVSLALALRFFLKSYFNLGQVHVFLSKGLVTS